MVSARGQELAIKTDMVTGAWSYLVKPGDGAELEARVPGASKLLEPAESSQN